jgi:hypothetical protein
MLFGDDEPDDLRAPSPWDDFISTPPSEAGSLEIQRPLKNRVPKLAPEVEEVRSGETTNSRFSYRFHCLPQGNVEYKLKLTDISPARFARLVTQLKWRLLEGSGQAYYELGVADSGALIGLSRADLEQSLETLETMAGEIGASVIVVKEIEVPPAMVAFADKVSAYIDPETGRWTDKMSNKRFRHGARVSGERTPVGTETETDTESEVSTPNYPPVTSVVTYTGCGAWSNPERPTAQSSPFIAPFDDDLALFSMEPEPELADDGENDGSELAPDADIPTLTDDEDKQCAELVADADVPAFSLDIEISVVHKPRPFRRRQHQVPGAGVFAGKHRGRAPKPKEAKKLELEPLPNKQEAKAQQRRLARDRRREEKRQALLAGAVNGVVVAKNDTMLPVKDVDVNSGMLADDVTNLANGLENLHVTVEAANTVIEELPEPTPLPASNETKEPRLIVEALVVRKMSIEEGFLDFGNFALT